jgi:hypothetical protein
MSFNTTVDNIVLSQSTQPENIAEKPFVSKEWSNPIFDTNTSAQYASNQVIFDTTTLSNSGTLVNYAEGLIALPMVIRVSNSVVGFDHASLENTDFMLGFKNSHVQLVHSVSITLNNIDIVQSVPMTNAYLSFIQHSELSSEDEWLNGPLTGYAKDNASSWYYNTPTVANTSVLTGDSRGCGIGNNCNFGLVDGLAVNDTHNSGLLRRQKFVNKYNAEKQAVLGNLDRNRPSCKNYVENLASGKYIYYDVVIRLKDLCPNLFSNLPMAKGMKFKIVLTLNNNITFEFKKDDAGNFVYNYQTFSNVTSATNPLMLSASYNKLTAQTGVKFQGTGANAVTAVEAGSYAFSLTDATSNVALVPCGSNTLPCATANTYTVSMAIGSKNGVQHQRPQCILYVPSYRLNPTYELDYYNPQSRIRKVHYTELEYQSFNVSPLNTFNVELSSSCVRPKRLILIPVLTAEDNFGLNPLSSPFASEPATTSPCLISSFNCAISNVNIFPNDINYDYDHYLQELNGQTGINGNIVNGLVSSRINLVDFQNNYHYIVCDLSRRTTAQDLTAVSIRVRGKVDSPKKLEIHAFIERERIIEIDVMTGALINRY